LVLLDVREAEERAFCSLPTSAATVDLHIPMAEIAGRVHEIRQASTAGPVIVYCHHGVRSLTVARWLAVRGVGAVHNLVGGIDAWAQSVDPSMPRY
jgi:rhodanese-related sulfurtransferase